MFTRIARSLKSYRIRNEALSRSEADWSAREAEAARLLADYRPATRVMGSVRPALAARVPTMSQDAWRRMVG